MGELSRRILKNILKTLYNHKDSIFNGIGNFAFGGISTSAIMKWHEHKKAKIEKRTDARIKEFNNIYKEFKHTDKRVKNAITNPKQEHQIETAYILATSHFSKYHILYPRKIINNDMRKQFKQRIYAQAYITPIENLILWCNRIHLRKADSTYLYSQTSYKYIKLLQNHKHIFQQFNKDNHIKICYHEYEEMKRNSERR